MSHITVLQKEAVEALVTQPDGVYIDGTFGRGGHSRLILSRLSPSGRLLVIDKDPEAIAMAQALAKQDPRVSVFHGSFAESGKALQICLGMTEVQGILLDLGVSSPQLDQAERGFSFMQDGPLDMRMDTSKGLSAVEWLEQVEEKTLADTLWQYGEERFARRIAKAIMLAREQAPINRTRQLAEVIARAVPMREKGKHPATRAFQAIRIVVNQELADLNAFLANAPQWLCPHGRCVIISFHSLEDRLVKQAFREWVHPTEKGPRELAGLLHVQKPSFRFIMKRLRPEASEVDANNRARSAVMRGVEKYA